MCTICTLPLCISASMRACSATTACNWTLSIPKLTKSPNQMTQMNPNDPIQGLQCRFACRMSLPPLLCICKLTFRANCSFLPLFWMGQARPGPVSSYLLLPAKDQSMSTPLIHDSSLQHQCTPMLLPSKLPHRIFQS